MINSNLPSLLTYSQVASNEAHHSESSIRCTIDELNRCSPHETFAMAWELRKIAERHYERYSQNEQKLEDVQLNAINGYDAKKIAANIDAYVNTVPRDKIPSALQTELKFAVYARAVYGLDSKLDYEQIVNIACALDHVDYAKVYPKDEIYKTIINKLMVMISQNCIRNVELDIWAVFALRKVKVDKNHLFNELCYKIIQNVNSILPLGLFLKTC